MTRIRVRQNGPYVIEDEGDGVIVVDWEGRSYACDRLPVALCRCGQSARKPFCDGSHRTVGFNGGLPAPDPPA